jgi:hypothetical protein
MKSGPKKVITSAILFEMIGDPEFYKIPAFAFLKKMGQATYKKLRQEAVDGCLSCGPGSNSMRAVTVAFVSQVIQLNEDNPDALTPLADYIAGRLGYRPSPLVVYYKGTNGVIKIEI